MKSSTRIPGALAAVALAAAAFLSQAQAAPTLSITLSPSGTVTPPGVVTADVFVSGLTDAVGAFAFDLGFNNSLMSFGSFTLDPDGKMGDAVDQVVDLGSSVFPLHVELVALAGFFDEGTLASLQLPGFRLASVSFNAQGNGIASFSLSNYSLSNFDGSASFADVTARGAEICVLAPRATSCDNGNNNNVPEPTTALLLAVAFGGLAAARRKQQAA